MSDDVVIRVENLSKQYRIGGRKEGYRTFRETLVDAAKAPFLRIGGAMSKAINSMRHAPSSMHAEGTSALPASSSMHAEGTSSLPAPRSPLSSQGDDLIWALKDVSFEVKRGEVVGIIGRNGAGKSTLLKILSRITEPTKGKVELRGRVGSLLEVGTGFHPELTGHENVYLYGAILGMDRWEVTRKFDEIVAFAEIEKFIDTPVKRYSSGMYMRLAFAVAAHMETEVLLVDEVLAVGDAAFQKKCLGKMGDVSKEGRTVLFVSHNLGAINALCNKCILLGKGRIEKLGTTDQVTSYYLSAKVSKESYVKLVPKPTEAFFTSVGIRDANGHYSTSLDAMETFDIIFNYSINQTLAGLEISFAVFNAMGVKIFTCFQDGCFLDPKGFYVKGQYTGEVTIPGAFLSPGFYTITAAIHQPNIRFFDIQEDLLGFHLVECGTRRYAYAGTDIGPILVNFDWKIKRL